MPDLLITRIGLLILLTFIYTAGASCTVSPPPSGPGIIRFGSQHTLACKFTASCLSSFWTKDGLLLSNNPNYTVTIESTGSSISFYATLSDTGNFVCNVIRSQFSTTPIKRYFNIFVEKAVEVHISPNTINSAEGGMISINCTAIGAPTPSSISWYHNGLPLNPVPESDKNTDQQTVTSRLVLQPLERDDEGNYSCSSYNAPSRIGFKTAHSSDALITVYYSPDFILQPPSIVEGIAGGNITLFCSVTANPLPPVVYWLTSNELNLTNISTSVVVSPKVINSTLTLENLQLSHELNYTCFVEQVIPSNNNRTLIEAQTQLLIEYPPQLSSPIHNVTTVNVSDEVTLSCEGFGNPRPVIEWYFTGKDGNEVQIHNASRSLPLSDRTIVSNLTLTNLTIDQEGSYRCKGTNNVTNLIGSKEDTSIHLTVHSPPQLLRQNSSFNYSLLVNESITLSFSISFASPPVRTERIVWTLTTRNGGIKEISTSDQFQISADGLSITIFLVSLEENGFIQLTVSNEVGTDSKGYYLLIGTSPCVGISPRHVGVAIGTQNISFTCSSSGHPIPLLTWYVNGQELSLSEDKYSLLYANNGTSVLALFDVGLSDAARYTCFASNVFGNDTVDNHLVVQVPPNVTLTPSQVTVSVTESLQLVCTSYGIPSVVLTWYFGTSKQPLESREGDINITQKTNEYSESLLMTTSILTIENITNAYWQGVFICEGFNGVTNLIETPENDTSEIFILIPPRVNVIGSNNLTAVISEPLTIAVSLSISSPPVTLADIMWSFTNASGYTIFINNSSEHHQFSTNLLTLKINDISYSDEGTYEVSVSTTVENDSAVIAVDVQTPPLPVASFTEMKVLIGSNATLSCEAASEPLHRFQWKFNFSDIATNETKYIISDDQLGEYGKLIITNTSPSDAGEYTCTVSNVHGVANITVILDVLVPPMLQYQPKSEPPYVDHSYNISVRVTNIPNPPVNSSSIAFKRIDNTSLSQVDIIYQKSMRLVNISFTNISVSDNGTYQLTVRNLAGEDTVDITLNIKALPQIYSTVYSILLQEGDSSLIDCKADGLPLPSVTWLANRRQIGAFSSTFTITELAIDSIRQGVPAVISRLNATDLLQTHNGSYECVVENQEGTTRIQYNISVVPVYISFCDNRPCKNGGTCMNGPFGYLCMCTEGWTEKNCTKFVTEKSKPQFLIYNRTFYREFGSTVLLSCPVTGYPQPNIIWFKDDVLLDGAITEDYEIKRLDLNTRGIYRCNATNELGSIVSDDMAIKIRGLVQYQANITFSQEYIRSFIDQEFRRKRQVEETYKATEERLNKLIDSMNSEMRKILSTNKSIDFNYISLELLSSSTINSLLDNITVVLSLESKSRGTAELTSTVKNAFSLLNEKLENLFHISDSVHVDNVRRFDGCPAEQTTSPSPNNDPALTFILDWQETDLTQMVTLRCPCGPERFDIGVVRNATRRCGGDFKTGAVWEPPTDEACNFSIAARKLCSLASLQNPDKVLAGLENITAVSSDMGPLELSISISLIDNLKTAISGNIELTDSYFTIADNIISIDSGVFIESNEESRTSNRLLQSFEAVTENYPIRTDETTIILRRRFLFVAQGLNVSRDRSDNFSLSIASNGNGFINTDYPVSLNNNVTDPLAAIFIPGSILSNIISEKTSTIRLMQTGFDNDLLFLRRSSLLSQWSHLRVGSVLISATFAQHNISNQEELITITLKKDKDLKTNATGAYCSFWDHSSDDNYGNWSNYGCSVLYQDSDTVICGCNHLTTFALLLDVSPNEENNPPPLPYQKFVNSLTFLGCAISTICLVVIILTYSIEKHLRNTNNGKLLINMSSALVGLYVSFIPASYAAPIEELCVVVGAFLHYFFLATFLSMASEATILYIELVKVFAKSKHGMIIKAIIVTWVTPIFIVGFSIAPNYKNYIYEDRFCRPTQWQFWIGSLGPFVSIYLYNWIMFLIIIVSLFKQQCKTQGGSNNSLQTSFKKQVLLVITLSILFGLGWGTGLAATSSISIQWLRYTLELSFVIAAGLQGILIFIFYGLRISKVRKTWLKWIYIITNQHVKAVEIDQTLRTTYTIRRSTRLKQSTYSLGTYADTNVELKQYKLPLTQSATANSYSSSTNSSATNADTPLSDPVKEREKVVHFIDNNDKEREDKLTSNDEHGQVVDNNKSEKIEINRQIFDAVGENDASQRDPEKVSISDLVPEPV